MRRHMYLMAMVDGLVSPYISSLWKTLFGELPIQVPIIELRVRETEAKKVAADVLEEITFKAIPTSLVSA